jgi:hypothetical protein
MLGENHSLVNEFPEYQEIIARLIESDEVFAKDSKHYKEIKETHKFNCPCAYNGKTLDNDSQNVSEKTTLFQSGLRAPYTDMKKTLIQ